MKKELFFFGVKTVIESDDAKFLSTVDNSLSFFRHSSKKNLSIIDDRKLYISYLKNQGADLAGVAQGYNQIGLNAYQKDNRYVYSEDGLMVQVEKKNGSLHILAQPLLRKDIRGLIKKRLFLNKIDYFLLVRKLVMFPVFHLLEKNRDVFLLHGSAINYRGKGISMAGLAGVGKSTCAIAMTLGDEQNTTFLTDNFLLFDKDYIYPFPEYIRLRDDMLKIVGNVAKLGDPVVRRYSRNHYILSDRFISGRVKTDTLFIPFLSDNEFVREINANVAMDRLLLANDHVKEFHTYHHSGLLEYLYYPAESTYGKRIKTLESFLSKTRIFELGIKKGREAYKTMKKVCGHVS